MGGNFSSLDGVKVPLLEDFELLAVVGAGGFGKVWQVKKKDSGQIYAMKVLKKKNVLEANLVEQATLEMEIMGKLSYHPFIISLHFAFQNSDKLYFVMDYMSGGSLFGHIRRAREPFSEDLVRFYAAEIILALEALHRDSIVYRDMKLESTKKKKAHQQKKTEKN
jgi:serine/threonine protein kinase